MRKPSNGNCRTFNEDVMKRIHSFMAAAFTMIVASSCVQELGNDGQLQEGAVVYKAVAEGADTKAVLGTNEAGRTQSMWENGDKITIHNGVKGYEFTTSAEDGSSVADFVYEGSDFTSDNGVIAVYPAGDYTVDMDKRTVMIVIPTQQEAVAGTYDGNAVPSVAYSLDNSLYFRNMGGLIKFRMNMDGVSAVRFSANGSIITGSYYARFDESGDIYYDYIPDIPEYNLDYALLSAPSGETLQKGSTYYISVMPNGYPGFNMEFLGADGQVVFSKAYNGNISIGRNKILNLGSIGRSSLSYEKLYVVGSYNAWRHEYNTFIYDFDGSDKVYEGVVDFNACGQWDPETNEFKFTGSNWGQDEYSQTAGDHLGTEPEVLGLIAGAGDNINAYQEYRFYHFTLNREDCTLTRNYAFNSIGVIGGFSAWSEDVDMNFNPETQKFWVDVEFAENDELMFRLDDGRNCSFGCNGNSGRLFSDGDNIPVAAGQYRIYVDLNNLDGMTYEFNADAYGTEECISGTGSWLYAPEPEPEPEPVEGWALVGEFNSWNGDELMTEIEPGLWGIAGFALEAGQQWKLRKDGGWDENYGGPGSEEPYNITIGETFTATFYGMNMAVSTSGIYDIYFDESKETILVLEAGSPLPDTDGTREVTLWEGEKLIDDWSSDESSYILSDGGTELLAAGAQPGDMVCFYVESFEEDWQLNISEGHWGPLYLEIDSNLYDLAAAGGKIVLPLTQEMLNSAFTQQWWGGTFVLNGDNLRLTKVTLLTDSSSSDPDPDPDPNPSPSLNDYVDEYGINHGPGVDIDGIIWAPVNCGYHAEDFKYGKLYQWGRKYGQGYDGEATTPVVEDGGISLIAGIHQDNANKFYKGSAVANNDWLYSGYSVLWNLGSEYKPVKTEYDPCPEGWRVPTSAELESLSLNYSEWTTNEEGQNGYWFCGSNEYTSEVSQIFLPAAGWRNSGGGIAALRGTLADYWSSTFKYPKAERLAFDNSGVQMGEAARAYGFSVRCVQDESELIPVTDICLDITELSLEVNRFSRLRATVTPSDANHSSNVYWESDNTDVATVDQNGSIRAISAGTAVISAVAGMQSAECKVIVTEESDDNGEAEVTIWEGNTILENWENQPTLLSDGGTELRNAGAQPGQTLYFYLEAIASDWHLELWEGHWGGLYVTVNSLDYDLSANGNRIGFTLTQDILDLAYTQHGWNGTFLLNGNNIKVTKITLQ